MRIKLEIAHITPKNKVEKFQKAIKELSKELKIPATIEPKENNNKESFPCQAQYDLYNQYVERFGLIMDDLYSRVCATLGMRPASTFKKAIDPNAPKLLRNEILWNPETGQPITQKEIDRLLNAIDKFMNRNMGPMKREFTLSQASIGKILANLRESSTYDDIRKIPLNELKYKKKPWDFYNTYGKLNDAFPGDYERLKFRERVVGNYIQDVTESTRKKIRDTIDQGYLAGKPKSEISADLFYRFGELNRDWDRTVDTEAVNIFNAEYIDEQKKDVQPGEELYFIRREYNDNKTCSFCIKATQEPIIAKWSDIPLQDDKIKDPVASIAIWNGKTNYGVKRDDWLWPEGTVHVKCRGMWDRYFEEFGEIEL